VTPVYFGDQRLPLRFWDKVSPEPNSGCWLWLGSHNEKGYGDLWFGDRLERAHRLAYEKLVADFPAEWLICHRCDNPACVNPAHLAPGTAAQNTADMVSKGRHVPAPRRGATCKRGHARSRANTLANGGCKACRRQLYHRRTH
jgi:hypothetical protein